MDQCAVAADVEMRRYAQVRDGGVVQVGGRVERAGEEPLHAVADISVGRQRETVDHGQRYGSTGRAVVAMRGGDLMGVINSP